MSLRFDDFLQKNSMKKTAIGAQSQPSESHSCGLAQGKFLEVGRRIAYCSKNMEKHSEIPVGFLTDFLMLQL